MKRSPMMRRKLMDSRQRSSRINLYVSDLETTVTEADLKRIFSALGPVIYVSIMNDEYIGSGQSRRYAYGKMEGKDQVEAAILSLFLPSMTLLRLVTNTGTEAEGQLKAAVSLF
jgi:RNA recognition motif-containing protein